MVTTKLQTIQDLMHIDAADTRYELIKGELLKVTPPNFEHGEIQANVVEILRRYVRLHRLGKIVTESGYILGREPDTVLGPDVSFVSRARLPDDPRTFPELSPDLVVEVVSSSDTRRTLERKVHIYLDSGVRAIWLIFPDRREVVVHRPGVTTRTHGDGDILNGGDILPGFAVSVADIFDG